MGSSKDTPFLAEHNQKLSSERPATRATDSFVDAPETPIAESSQIDFAATPTATTTAPAPSSPSAKITLPASEVQEHMNKDQDPVNTTVDRSDTFYTVAEAPVASPATSTATQLPGDLVAAPALPQSTPPMSHGSLPTSNTEQGQTTHSHQQEPEQQQREQSQEQKQAQKEDSGRQQQQRPLHTQGTQQDSSQTRTESHSQSPSPARASKDPRSPPSPSQSPQSQQKKQSDSQPHTVTSASAATPVSPSAPEPEPSEQPGNSAGLDTHLSSAPTMHSQDLPTHLLSDVHSLHLTVNSHDHDHGHDPSLSLASASANSDDITKEKAAASQEKAMVNEDARSGTDSAITPAIGSDIGHGADVSETTHKAKKKHSKADGGDDDMSTATAPSLTITLLLTNGARHPFEISSRYLKKRNQNVEGLDPFNMSVYTLKELILKEWRSDWETPPASPTSIRLISFGKMLDDKAPLSECKFNHDAPNVVHMTLRPPSVVEEENDPRSSKGATQREREADERTPTCCCVMM